MKVSIIVPTYNRIDVLPRALDSVLAQTNSEAFEIIVIDDGSTDGTAELVERDYAMVRLIKQANLGVSAARNAGIKLAKGEWFALLDSDDEWLPGKLDRQFAELHATGLQVCHTQEIWVRNGVRVNQMNKHQKYGGWIFDHCLPLCAMSPSSIVIHRSVFEQVASEGFTVFDETLPACEDYELWLRICSRFEVAYLEQPGIRKFGGHADQLSRQHWGMDRFRVIALEKFLLDDRHLSAEMIEPAKAMLLSKTNILLTGARKHSNQELIADCEARLVRWS